MTVGIVDIGIGNLGSLRHAIHSQGWDSVTVTGPADFDDITHLLLPGVGAFAAAMAGLEETGLIDPIQQFAAEGHPVLGICLGMQLLGEVGTEGGNITGLGLIPGQVRPIASRPGLRLPHMGWNEARQVRAHPVLKGIRNDVDFYFVHSYRFVATDALTVLAETEYGECFPAVIGKGNVIGAQFHPEKSQSNGLRLLDNFCCWDGAC